MVNKIILGLIFCTVFTSFIANPAPISIEIEDLILIGLPSLLCLLCLVTTPEYSFTKIEYDLFRAIALYSIYLVFSVMIGLLQGVVLLSILRAIGPYINFFPLLAICILPTRQVNPWLISSILISVGLIQAGYQLYLYFHNVNEITNSIAVLRGRITLLDQRATLPIILSAAVLPFALFSKKYPSFKITFIFKFIALNLILLGMLGSVATLTRSMVLSVFFGWIMFAGLSIYQNAAHDKIKFISLATKFIVRSLILLTVFLTISMIPKIYMLEQGLIMRFFPTSSFGSSVDYSNGRVFDEWIPALNVWMNSDLINLLFGIGAGNTFTIANGETRSYIHNLLIYNLVYGGLFGLVVSIWLYITAFKTLIIRSLQTRQSIYLGLAALLSSLFFYGQLFAVHKGLAFNAMLFLILGIALCQPQQTNFAQSTNHEEI